MGEYAGLVIPLNVLEAAPKIGPAAFLVFAAIAKYANRKTGESCPGLECIARDTGLGVRSVQVAVKAMCDAGLLTATQRCRAPTLYRLAASGKEKRAPVVDIDVVVVGRVPMIGEWEIIAICRDEHSARKHCRDRECFTMGPLRTDHPIAGDVAIAFCDALTVDEPPAIGDTVRQ